MNDIDQQISPKETSSLYKIRRLFISGDIWSHIYGIFGVVSLSFSIIVIFRSSNTPASDSSEGLNTLISSVSLTSILILCTFIFSVFYYQRRLRILGNMPMKVHLLERENDLLNIQLRAQAECSHTISHYLRNITNLLDDFVIRIDKENWKDDISQQSCDEILIKCKNFLTNTTVSLRNYYTIASGYHCSITIKLAFRNENEGEYFIKTLFRDPISLKSRRYVENHYLYEGGIYPASENTAFSLILSNEHINNSFGSNNLKRDHTRHEYFNSNRFWHKHYNATIAVPISIILNSTEKDVIGFLTVDNMAGDDGNLNDCTKIEFLHSIGDNLYNFTKNYTKIITFANQNFKPDDFHKQIYSWG